MTNTTTGHGTARRQVPNIASPGAMTMEAAGFIMGLGIYTEEPEERNDFIDRLNILADAVRREDSHE